MGREEEADAAFERLGAKAESTHAQRWSKIRGFDVGHEELNWL